jgi:hypothetical protein
MVDKSATRVVCSTRRPKCARNKPLTPGEWLSMIEHEVRSHLQHVSTALDVAVALLPLLGLDADRRPKSGSAVVSG